MTKSIEEKVAEARILMIEKRDQYELATNNYYNLKYEALL